jgi:hypothetical protein
MEVTKEIKSIVTKAINVFAEEICITDDLVQICICPDENLMPQYFIVNTNILNEDKNGLLKIVDVEANILKRLSFVSLMLRANNEKMDWSGKYKGIDLMFVQPYFKKIFKFVNKEFEIPFEDIKIIFFTNQQKITEDKIFLTLYNDNKLVKQINEQQLMDYSNKI